MLLARTIVPVLLAVAARVQAVGFPFGTANAILDSVNAATEQDAFAFDSPSVQQPIFVRLTRLSGNLQPTFHIASAGHGGGCSGQGIGPALEIENCLLVPNATYAVTIPWTTGPLGSGNYRAYFQSFAAPQGATTIAYGQTLSGNIAEAGQIDTWVFEGQSGDQFHIQTTRTSGQVDAEPRLFYGSPNTGTLGQGVPCSGDVDPNDNPQVTYTCTLSETGTFVVLVDDVNDGATGAIDPIETGEYTLSLTCLDGPCTAGSTSTTTTPSSTSSTTSTTIAPTTVEPIDGANLVLKTPAQASKHALMVASSDVDITLGSGNGSADDPRTAGATLRVFTTHGDLFDHTYALPAAHWKVVGGDGQNKGYKFAFAAGAPIRSAVVKPKVLKVVAGGAALGESLAADPNPVQIVFSMGGVRYCASFGGTTKFKANKRYGAKLASAPGGCP